MDDLGKDLALVGLYLLDFCLGLETTYVGARVWTLPEGKKFWVFFLREIRDFSLGMGNPILLVPDPSPQVPHLPLVALLRK